MKTDLVLVGVGGQGVLTIGAVIAKAAARSGLVVKQGESHGMSQRGGVVQAHLRLADGPIHGDLVCSGAADLVLAMEPLEALRAAPVLAPHGMLVTSIEPIRNLADYPPLDGLLERLRALPHTIAVPTADLAHTAGAARASNMVLVGAVAPWLPIAADRLEDEIRRTFAAKGDAVVATCLHAFRLGLEYATCPIR